MAAEEKPTADINIDANTKDPVFTNIFLTPTLRFVTLCSSIDKALPTKTQTSSQIDKLDQKDIKSYANPNLKRFEWLFFILLCVTKGLAPLAFMSHFRPEGKSATARALV